MKQLVANTIHTFTVLAMSSVKAGTIPDNTAATESPKRMHVAIDIVVFAPVNNSYQLNASINQIIMKEKGRFPQIVMSGSTLSLTKIQALFPLRRYTCNYYLSYNIS